MHGFRLITVASATFVVAPLASQVRATQRPRLPSARAVLARYVEALGGRSAIFAHRSMTVRERVEIPARGLRLERVIRNVGRASRDRLEIPTGGSYESGYDAGVAWDIPPGAPPRIMRGGEALSKARDADMYYPARVLDYFDSLKVVGVERFEEHICYHLKGVNRWGQVNEHFYDTTTGLLVGYRFNSAWRGGAGEERMVVTAYRRFGRWLMPTRIEHRSARETLVEEIDTVTFDNVPHSAVALPDTIAALARTEHGP